LARYESAKILSVHYEVTLDAGKNNQLVVAMTTTAAEPDDHYKCIGAKVVDGHDHQRVTDSFDIDLGSYGREIRSLPPGNPPPHFHHYFTGASTASARIKILMTVLPSGTGILHYTDISSSSLSAMKSISSQLPALSQASLTLG
jgi:hypothetical protein